MKKKKNITLISIFIIKVLLILILSLFLTRALLPKQLDDVSPEIQCDKELLEKADVFYVVPKYNNVSISDNKAWCNEILSMNKKLALHGVYHTYREFITDRDDKYLQEGIDIFEACFNKKPEIFKSPQIMISKNNKELIKQKMKIDLKLNQVFHKVYHCEDTGIFSNRIIDIF